jgi:hypothetical protein
MPSRAAMPALSTLIPAAPPKVALLLMVMVRGVDGALSRGRTRADPSRAFTGRT